MHLVTCSACQNHYLSVVEILVERRPEASRTLPHNPGDLDVPADFSLERLAAPT